MKTRCPKCGHIQRRTATVARVKCAGCGKDYYRFKSALKPRAEALA